MFGLTPSKNTSLFPDQLSSSYLNYEQGLTRFNPEDHNNTQIRHSGVTEGFQPEYVQFADLPKLADSCELDKLLEHILLRLEDTHNWHPYFEAITDIRSLFKNLPDRVNEILACFAQHLLNALNHRKNCVVKNALVALSDFYEHSDKFPVAYHYTKVVLNGLLNKAMCAHKVLRDLTHSTLHYLIKNNRCDQLLQQLCEMATNHNLSSGAVGFHFLVLALNHCQDEVSSFDQKTNEMVFTTISFVLRCQKDGKLKEIARNIVKFYGNIMGQEGLVGFLHFNINKGNMSNEEAGLIYNAYGKPDKPSFPRLSLEVNRMRQSMRGLSTFGVA